MKIEKSQKSSKGITLIALVITIIVLLILAGVAINLTIGDNGLFKRVENAAETWELAEANEQKEMEEAGQFLEDYMEEYNKATTVSYAKQLNKPYEIDTTIKDDLENEIRIPEGFKISEDSGTKVEEGIVIEDKDGNQFVWIPAKTEEEGGAIIHTTTGDTTIEYKRTSFEEEDLTSSFTEDMPTDEEASVNAWGGYYIGRFEAGDEESLDDEGNKIYRTEISSTANKIAIKSGQVPYNYITQADAKTKAEEMDIIQGYTATTKLVSSYAWDTAINFIQIKTNNYGTNSSQGNYYDTTFTYINITGISQAKSSLSTILVPTGQTTPVSNIYDMGGNLFEYTTENYLGEDTTYVRRGGSYLSNLEKYPAGYRNNNTGNAGTNSGFRVTLYCKT